MTFINIKLEVPADGHLTIATINAKGDFTLRKHVPEPPPPPAPESGAGARLLQVYERLQAIGEKYGCEPGENRLDWLERFLTTEPYMWVIEHQGYFDPRHGGEPPSTEFLDGPKPGAFPLFRQPVTRPPEADAGRLREALSRVRSYVDGSGNVSQGYALGMIDSAIERFDHAALAATTASPDKGQGK